MSFVKGVLVMRMKRILKTLIVSLFFSFITFTNIEAAENPYVYSYYSDSGKLCYNCTYYAWKRTYDVTGVALPGFKGHAKGWYQGAVNAGYTVSSVPRVNSVAVWTDSSFGHVAFVESVSGNNVTISEAGTNDGATSYSCNTYTKETLNNRWGQTLLGYIYVGNSSSSTGIPAAVTNLRSEKTVYNSKESITFSWDSSYGTQNYWVYLWKDGVQLYALDCGTNTTFTSAPTAPGKYTLAIRPGNVNGFNESSKSYSFIVTDSIPAAVTNLQSEKTVYNSKERITFSWDSSYGTQNYWVYLWKDGVQLYTLDCGTNTTFTSAPTAPGKYTLAIRPGNVNGFNESSKSYSFIVTDSIPAAVTNLRSEKTVYNSKESITFSWDSSYGTQNYWVYLWKDGVQLYALDCGTNTTFTSAPTAPGKYTLAIRPGNVNGFNESSKSYSFIVTDSTVNEEEIAQNKSQSTINTTTTDEATGKATLPEGRVWQDANKAKGTYRVTASDPTKGTVTYLAPLDKKQATVTIPATATIDGVTYRVTAIEKNAFKNNRYIKRVIIGNNIITIGDDAFYGCKKLENVNFGENVKIIGNKAFCKCVTLAKVTIPSKVKTIGKQAFYACKKLKSATIGKGVAKIGSKALYGCSKMKTLTIKSSKLTAKKIGSKAFSKTPKKMTVKVPKKKFKAYKKMLIKRGVNKKAKFKTVQ
ncbi:CHAP domain-containing protein [Clostridium sp. AF36-4]|nr:CHAP domain-containing protein [Clostridium sp. AF36-4]